MLTTQEPLKKMIAENISQQLPEEYLYMQEQGSHSYVIEQKESSVTATLFFVHDKDTDKRAVIKVLRRYKDDRYSFRTVKERRACQIEAYKRNKKFTPGVYHGLGRISTGNPHKLNIGEIIEIDGLIKTYESGESDLLIKSKKIEILVSKAEYALIMEWLPEGKQLDHLLQTKSHEKIRNYVEILTQHIIKMHEELLPSSSEESQKWGRSDILLDKLEANLKFSDQLLTYESVKEAIPGIFDKILFHVRLKRIILHLQRTLKRISSEGRLDEHFQRRVREERIKHCHGDLKAPNIWIDSGQGLEENVYVLDAIDFNPLFCHIDVLSDLAMLVVDIQARTSSLKLAEMMVKEYLHATQQTDKAAKVVLIYYLIEKALVCAVISFVYDRLPQLGWEYIKIARKYVRDLKILVEAPVLKNKITQRQHSSSKKALAFPSIAEKEAPSPVFSGKFQPN